MENLNKKPKKSILKSSSSFEQAECPSKHHNTEPIKWDEMNILETLHPPEKDYGLMKIDEPKTPYSYYEDSGNEGPNIEHGGESSKIELSSFMKNIDRPAKILIDSEPSEDSDEEVLTEEERKKKREFEIHRKLHYNEYKAIKLARKLLEEEEEEENATESQVEENIIEKADGEHSNTNNENL